MAELEYDWVTMGLTSAKTVESRDEVQLAEVTEGLLQERANERNTCHSVPSNRSPSTRIYCVLGLALSFITGAAILPYGIFTIHIYHNSNGHERSNVSQIFREILPLIINFGITILTEALGLINATGLRWNLMREGRLQFNANLRLFTSSQRNTPNSWYCNLLNMVFLILCYTSSSLVLVASARQGGMPDLSSEGGALGEDNGYFAVSGMALVTLAIGILGQAFFASWVLRTIDIPIWSSSPIDTALVFCQRGTRRQPTQTMRSIGDPSSSIPSRPLSVQKSAFTSHKHIRRVLWILWALVLFGLIWTIGVTAGAYHRVAGCESCGIWTGPGWWPVPGVGGPSPFVALDVGFGDDPAGPVALIIIFGLQAAITLGLHCAELLVNISRDEDVWRKTYKAGGYDSKNYESIAAAATNWKTVVLFLLKPAIHWLYGVGNACIDGGTIIMRPGQLMWMTFAILFLAIYGTLIARYHRTGPQPVAYGHLQTIIDLIDTWDERIHWGHISEDQHGICHAGTSSKALPAIRMDKDYL